MDESQYTEHLQLAMVTHINHQPELVAGLNFTEVLIVVAIAFALGAPIGTGIAFAIGKPIFSLGIGFGMAILFGYIATKIMKHLKRQRPDGYYAQRMMKTFDVLIPGVSFVVHQGYYDRYRHDETT